MSTSEATKEGHRMLMDKGKRRKAGSGTLVSGTDVAVGQGTITLWLMSHIPRFQPPNSHQLACAQAVP